MAARAVDFLAEIGREPGRQAGGIDGELQHPPDPVDVAGLAVEEPPDQPVDQGRAVEVGPEEPVARPARPVAWTVSSPCSSR